MAHGGKGLGLRENLRIGSYADFEILGPAALFDQEQLKCSGLLGAGSDSRKIHADSRDDISARCCGTAGIPADLLLNHALEKRCNKRHTGRLYGLEIDRGE